MKWPWSKKPASPIVPPYVPPVRDVAKPEEGLSVEEHDTSKMTQTGIHKAWKRLSGKE